LAFVVRQPLIKRISATTATSNLFSSILFSIFSLVFLGEQYLNFGAAEFGLLGSIAAIGSLIGAVSTTPLIKLVGEGTLISASAFFMGFVFLLIPFAVSLDNAATLPVLFVANFLNGFLTLTYNITQVSARQRLCPPELLGRMNASIRFFVWGVMPIGGLLGGGIATAFGTQAALWTGAIGAVFASSFVVFSPLTKMKKLPDSPVETK
jgi:MFS family permease